jgi:thiol-disulfide isomerase/thioredoxin
MPTVKRRGKNRRLSRRKQTPYSRMSSVGRMFPPVDIRESGSMDELMKRVRSGPITIVLVYADWCGHCTEFMPHFDKAAKSNMRTAQVAKINESAVESMNMALKSMNQSAKTPTIEGYPTVISIDTKGNSVANINAIKDSAVMEQVMAKAGPAAIESSNMNSTMKSTNMKSNMMLNTSLPPVVSSNNSAIQNSANSAKYNNDDPILVMPPHTSDDLIGSPQNLMKGGCLYSALARSAWNLAPAGVLLGLASMTMRKRKSKHRKSRRR